MRHRLSFLLTILLQTSVCTPSLRACQTESMSSFLSWTLGSPRSCMSTVEQVVVQRGTMMSPAPVAQQGSKWRELLGNVRVVRLEPGCGRTVNRLATLSDGSRACVRYGVDQDQVLGETLCYYLATLLGISNVLPPALTKPDPSSWQWSAVRDSMESLNWSSEAIVSLTQWVPGATRVPIPGQFRRGMGLRLAPWTLETLSPNYLMQWYDLVLFDYLTANFDRVASHLFSLQWDRRAMDRPTNNLLKTVEGHLVFIDNEAGLVHGYRVLDRWEHLHQMLLNSTCSFRDSTVRRLTELRSSRSAAQRLRQVYQAREPFALELGFLSDAQMVTLQNRVDILYRHFQLCATVM